MSHYFTSCVVQNNKVPTLKLLHKGLDLDPKHNYYAQLVCHKQTRRQTYLQYNYPAWEQNQKCPQFIFKTNQKTAL